MIKKKNREKTPATEEKKAEEKKSRKKSKKGWQEENNNWRFYEHNKPVINWKKNPRKVVLLQQRWTSTKQYNL